MLLQSRSRLWQEGKVRGNRQVEEITFSGMQQCTLGLHPYGKQSCRLQASLICFTGTIAVQNFSSSPRSICGCTDADADGTCQSFTRHPCGSCAN